MVSNVINELKQLKLSQKEYTLDTYSIISSLKGDILSIRDSIRNNNIFLKEDNNTKVNDTINKLNKVEESSYLKNFNFSANNYYSNLIKYSKELSNNLENLNAYEDIPSKINKPSFISILVKDLYRKGNFKTADSLLKESKIDFNDNFRRLYQDLNIITQDLKNNHLDSLNDWITTNKESLKRLKSSIQFDFALLKFILLTDKHLSKMEIFIKGREIFSSFTLNDKYTPLIARAYTYITLKDSNCEDYLQFKYKDLSKENILSSIIDNFIHDCCAILNLPQESGFYITLLSGIVAMPQILKAENIIKEKKNLLTTQELPYEIILPNELKFHSIFICPVLKEVSNEENPPMLLTCGHVVSKNALSKMTKSTYGNNSNQIKCPTCPNTQSINECVELKIF